MTAVLVPRLPSREETKALRRYLAEGGRDVELPIGPRVVDGATLEHSSRLRSLAATVEGSTLTVVRLPETRAPGLYQINVTASPTAFVGRIDPAAGVARGTVSTTMQEDSRRVALIAGLSAAVVGGLLLGLVLWWLGLVVFVVMSALVVAGGRLPSRRFAIIIAGDLVGMSQLVASERDRSSNSGAG